MSSKSSGESRSRKFAERAIPVLVFDGDCGFCTTVARHFEKRSFTPLTIAAWQLADLGALGLTPAQASAQVYLVTERGAFGGAECFCRTHENSGRPVSPIRGLGHATTGHPQAVRVGLSARGRKSPQAAGRNTSVRHGTAGSRGLTRSRRRLTADD